MHCSEPTNNCAPAGRGLAFGGSKNNLHLYSTTLPNIITDSIQHL